jgi:hypothetical protein
MEEVIDEHEEEPDQETPEPELKEEDESDQKDGMPVDQDGADNGGFEAAEDDDDALLSEFAGKVRELASKDENHREGMKTAQDVVKVLTSSVKGSIRDKGHATEGTYGRQDSLGCFAQRKQAARQRQGPAAEKVARPKRTMARSQHRAGRLHVSPSVQGCAAGSHQRLGQTRVGSHAPASKRTRHNAGEGPDEPRRDEPPGNG